MSTSYNGNIKFTVFGQSHAPEIGVTIEGLPLGFEPDFDELNTFLQRRAPGRSGIGTTRNEADIPEFSELTDGKITAIIRNTDIRPEDYSELKFKPRPGHADYTAYVKYGSIPSGGGQFSGRMTAPLCIVGGLCLQILKAQGITVISRIAELAAFAMRASFIAQLPTTPSPSLTPSAARK